MLIDSLQAGRRIYHKTMNLPNVSQKKKNNEFAENKASLVIQKYYNTIASTRCEI